MVCLIGFLYKTPIQLPDTIGNKSILIPNKVDSDNNLTDIFNKYLVSVKLIVI